MALQPNETKPNQSFVLGKHKRTHRATGERRNVDNIGENRLLFWLTVSFALAALWMDENGRQTHWITRAHLPKMSIRRRYSSFYTENIQLSVSCWTEIIIKANIIIVCLIIWCAHGTSMRVVRLTVWISTHSNIFHTHDGRTVVFVIRKSHPNQIITLC